VKRAIVIGVLLALSALAAPSGSGSATLVAAHRGGAALWPPT